MKLANLITLARIALVGIGLVMLALHPGGEPGAWWPSWIIFGLMLFAAGTDFVDGYVARKLGQVSRLGRILDPLADKILVCGTLTMLLRIDALDGMLPAWVVVVILSRELIVTSLRGAVETAGGEFGADSFGKWKMVVQCCLVCNLLGFLAGWTALAGWHWIWLWGSVVFTVLSGGNYLRKAWRVLEF